MLDARTEPPEVHSLVCLLPGSLVHTDTTVRPNLLSQAATQAGMHALSAALCRQFGELLSTSAPRTCPDLAWDGSIKGYVQRPASADASAPSKDTPIQNLASVDALLQYLQQQLEGSKCQEQLARALHKAGIMTHLSAACGFATPSTVLLAEQLYGFLALACVEFRQDALHEGSVHALLGLLLHASGSSTDTTNTATVSTSNDISSNRDSSHGKGCSAVAPASAAVQLAALERLTGALDAASGQEFMHFIGKGGGLQTVVRIMQLLGGLPIATDAQQQTGYLVASSAAGSDAAAYSAAMVKSSKQVFVACLQRTRRMKRLGARRAPRVGYWAQLSPSQVLQLEQTALAQPQHQQAASPCLDGVTEAAADAHACSAAGSKASEAAAKGTATTQEFIGGAYDEDGIRVAWDNAPSAEAQAARQAWRSIPLADKLTWTQTATDLDVRLLLPASTSKRDLCVDIAPQRLTVSLGWHGRVLDGPLTGCIKSRAALWVIEAPSSPVPSIATPHAAASMSAGAIKSSCTAGAGAVVKAASIGSSSAWEEWPVLQLLLPKDDAGHFWRGLFQGGEEKSHWQILQEAVQCSDADACGDAAMASTDVQRQAAMLVEQLRERQAMVASGQLDLENGFDDFRVVLGDAGL